MSFSPIISVVIPLHNKAETITRALNSALTQDLQEPCEIIVVDDGSTDTSSIQVTNFNDPRIKLVKQKNSGVSAARNRGVSEAKSDYIAFLDADDEWKPNFLSLIWHLIQDFPNAGAYATGYFLQYPDKKIIQAKIKHALPDNSSGLLENYFSCVMNGNGPIWSSAVCIPKKILNELGGFPEDIHMQEDLQMWVKIALKYPIAFCPKSASIYHKDAVNSACKHIVPTRQAMLFADTINTAISNSTLKDQHAYYASGYINRYAFQNAFKSIVGNEKSVAAEILTLIKPLSLKDNIRLFLLKCMITTPNTITHKIWLSGKWIKDKTRRSE